MFLHFLYLFILPPNGDVMGIGTVQWRMVIGWDGENIMGWGGDRDKIVCDVRQSLIQLLVVWLLITSAMCCYCGWTGHQTSGPSVCQISR